MATLVLGIAGQAIGGALLPGGLSLLGSTLTGSAIGGAAGALAGAFVDQALLGPLAAASGASSLHAGPRAFGFEARQFERRHAAAARLWPRAAAGAS